MTTGLDEILANIHKLQVNNKRVARQAVAEGAELFAKNLEANTPLGVYGPKRYSSKTSLAFGGNGGSERMKSDVAISGFKGGPQGQIEKDIGYGKSTGWRVKYPDDGTINQLPQYFKEKTIQESTAPIQELYAKKIQEGLKL